MTRPLALAALALCVATGAGCGKYGKPVRSQPAPASVSAQPGAAAPQGESCEEGEHGPEPAP
jgi:hypothetical protein